MPGGRNQQRLTSNSQIYQQQKFRSYLQNSCVVCQCKCTNWITPKISALHVQQSPVMPLPMTTIPVASHEQPISLSLLAAYIEYSSHTPSQTCEDRWCCHKGPFNGFRARPILMRVSTCQLYHWQAVLLLCCHAAARKVALATMLPRS